MGQAGWPCPVLVQPTKVPPTLHGLTCKWSRSAAAAHRCVLDTAAGTAGFLLLISEPADVAEEDRGRHSLLAGLTGSWTGTGVVKEMAPAVLMATLLPAEAAQPDLW